MAMEITSLLFVLQLVTTFHLVKGEGTSSNVDIIIINETLIDSNGSSIINASFENTTDVDYLDFTTTVPPETTLIPVTYIDDKPRILGVEHYCTCDLTANSCDINCCCDDDCSSEDRKIFSYCKNRSQRVADDKYCIQENIMFANNTEFETTLKSDDILCIVTDNLEDSNLFPEVESTNTIDEFENLEKRSQPYPWYQKGTPTSDFIKSYSYGSPVWIIEKDGIGHKFELPSTFSSIVCDNKQSILYLQDYETICKIKVDNLKEQCVEESNFNVNSYIKLLFKGKLKEKEVSENQTSTTQEPSKQNTTASPVVEEDGTKPSTAVNNSKETPKQKEMLKKEEQEDIYIANFKVVPVTFINCEYVDGKATPCRENKILPPTLVDEFCVNALKSIEFTILHNGTAGIQEVVTKFILSSVGVETKTFQQSYKVNFRWIQDNESDTFPRSGRPGYIVGKPVLMGKLIANETDEESINDYIEIEKDPSNWLTVSTPSTNMNCGNLRKSINFGENVRSGCILNIPLRSCHAIQKQILLELLGVDLALGLMEGYLKIAMFGDSNINHLHEWVSLLIGTELRDTLTNEADEENMASRCDNIIFGLEIKIHYVYQGSFANPQAKIVGAFIGKGLQEDLSFTCANILLCAEKSYTEPFELSSTITFINVGKASEKHYPEAPSFDIKFPKDFFYPFLPSRSSNVPKGSLVAYNIAIFLCVFVNIGRI